MTGPWTEAGPETENGLPAAPADPPAPPRFHGPRLALLVAAALTVLGAPLGLLWAWWSPSRPFAQIVGVHRFWGMFDVATVYPQESEAWAAGDGRFATLMLLVGLAAAVLLWFARVERGPWPIAGLAAGAVLGSVVAGVVGFAVGGGHVSGATNDVVRTALWVHTYPLYFVQGAAAVLVYVLFVAFAARDDLSRG